MRRREEGLRLLFRRIVRESRLLPKIDAALIRMLLGPTDELSIDAKAE